MYLGFFSHLPEPQLGLQDCLGVLNRNFESKDLGEENRHVVYGWKVPDESPSTTPF